MAMLHMVFGGDPSVQYGPSFLSGPLGDDADICVLICSGDLVGAIFFMGPLSTHNHQVGINCLARLCNVHNIITSTNPTTDHDVTILGRKYLIHIFFFSLQSPSVGVYKAKQMAELERKGRT